MTIKDCISQMISSSGNIFETDQERVIASILQSENVMFLDTCFITKSSHIEKEGLFEAFEKIAGGKEKQKIVFVVTELVLYELKDSVSNVLQVKNQEFFEKMIEHGFCLLLLREETVFENIKTFMRYSSEKWNRIFSTLIHDNIANLSFNGLIRNDRRMPYYGFSECGYNVPADRDYIKDIIVYLKNVKKNKDSMAEELICISLFSIFELTHGSTRNTYIFCTHDFGAVARMNKAIQISYPDELKQFKNINAFTIIQYMIKEEIITSKTQALNSMKKIMGERVKLMIREEAPFSSIEKTIEIEEAVDRIFNKESVVLVGNKGID